MGQSVAIEINHLCTGYKTKGRPVIISSEINEVLWKSRLTCLLGRNGSGKSTLLKTLSTFLPPLSGEILFDGSPLSSFKPKELARVLSVVLTDRPAVTNLTVKELVATGRSPYTGYWGSLSKSDMEITDRALNLVGIEDLSRRNVATLSDGERQKAMIAKSLAQETPVIFLDEPTAFLDYPSKIETLLLLRNLAKTEKKTIFLSTHDVEVALQIADCLWLLDKEKGLTAGSPKELSVNGVIADYFSTPGLVYDPDNFRFVIT